MNFITPYGTTNRVTNNLLGLNGSWREELSGDH